MESLMGQLLVASPRLNDENFYRSVVLVVQHDAEGAFGLVLNRPGPRCFQELWSEVGEGPCPIDLPIHIGGPVSGPLMALHANPDLADRPAVLPGVYFNALGRDALKELMDGDQPFRLFSGYAGWGKQQLDEEMRVGGWLTLRASCEDVFFDLAMDLWNHCRCRVGDEILAQSLDIKLAVGDPELN